MPPRRRRLLNNARYRLRELWPNNVRHTRNAVRSHVPKLLNHREPARGEERIECPVNEVDGYAHARQVSEGGL